MTEGLQEVTREVDVQYDTHKSNPVFPGWVILSLQLLVGLSLLLMQGGASKIISLTTEADTQSCGGKPQALDSAEHLPIMHLKHDADRGYRQALHEMMLIALAQLAAPTATMISNLSRKEPETHSRLSKRVSQNQEAQSKATQIHGDGHEYDDKNAATRDWFSK